MSGLRMAPWLVASVTAIAFFALVAQADAQTYTVTNLSDSGVAGDGSLRGEIRAANANPGPDTIAFAAGVSGLLVINGSGFVIDDSVDIEGPGAEGLTIEQIASKHRVFQIKLGEPGAVTLAGMTIRGGDSEGPGGDIENTLGPVAALTVSGCRVIYGYAAEDGGGIDSVNQPLTVRASAIEENETGESGGGIWAGGNQPIRIEDSTIAGNISTYGGAGLFGGSEAGTSTVISDSTVSGNHALLAGGGANLSIYGGATLAISNSTFVGNRTGTWGGAIALASIGPATIEGTTIVGNEAEANSNAAGGLEGFGPAPVQLIDTIVAGNKSPHTTSPDIGGAWNSAFSLIGDPTGATIAETVPGSDLIGVDPQLGPLGANGGPTATMAPSPGSPVVNKGGGTLGTDQRGDPRPVVFPGVALSAAPGANGADIGAVELQAPPPPAGESSRPGSSTPPPPTKASPIGPRVRVSCPKSAKPGGCHFAVQAVSAKPRPQGKGGHARAEAPQPESAVARVKLGPGGSALLTLTPKPKYAARLLAARRVLVREVATIGGVGHTTYRRLATVG
ncbi:MAG: hypothetical protein BGO11_09865 [Solirubrobacterales bacterium 70-9]|nr:MAG: hypothetical protein BGO11_09865 [Solirubrobacterales bacterium 70-9]